MTLWSLLFLLLLLSLLLLVVVVVDGTKVGNLFLQPITFAALVYSFLFNY